MFFKKKHTDTSEAKIEELLSRGVDEVINRDHLKEKLRSGKRLRVKLGIDPTSPHLHLGRSVPLLKLRDFQKLGHKAILIIGDFTGIIGDTSDKESERPMLSREKVAQNKKTYFTQIGKIIDLTSAELEHNSKWLSVLDYNDVGNHANAFSVADFIARDNIKQRLDAGKRVSLREVLYPLMQGYDSVAVRADVEIGGVDQRFNLLAGRTLQERHNQEPQDIVMTTFPVEGTDGRKMSSSWGNTITFNDNPEDMFGRIMRVRDELIERYFTLLTRVSIKDIQKSMKQHPRDAKMHLAREIVTIYYDASVAQKAQQHFIETFREGVVPSDTTQVQLNNNLKDTLVGTGILASNSQWRRLIDAGAVTNTDTGETITDIEYVPQHTTVFKIGKRRFVRVSK